MASPPEGSHPEPEETIRRCAVELLAISQTGLTYASDVFDRQRYEQVREAATSLLALIGSGDLGTLRRQLELETGYATPKVGVRGAVFDARHRVLLVRERSDGRWSLPGGWCDVLESPSESVCREVLEEAGVAARATHLVAVVDRQHRGEAPPRAFHIYNLLFLCTQVGGAAAPDRTETSEVGWFELDALPTLSEGRVNEAELRLAHAHLLDPGLATEFD
ncbi:MAG: NUDIX hydrolase N-terminal domain-containing protein [Candidatus Dormibacteraeota bacterium]|nr:NUDIX hydrolase N-terminal domain-containing protein [Candidatus Dormibacteraeota bacterium]MBO0761001.1 NUDIX hydrolase N-terminal domain-containing protein [Candidatus Dormibacteraeota bacterium]